MLYILLLLTLTVIVLNVLILQKLAPHRSRHIKAALLDTSALMDGRILEVVKSGFVPAQLLIPRFVIAELQLLADKADHLKRERARFGLTTIQDLQESRYTEVLIIGDDVKSESGVDEKLVKVAVKRGALLFTTDYNLLKVAEIEGVQVLNINELTQNLRPTRLPGERADIKIVAKGQERTQGVGYLDDGTLVVVEKAGTLHGKTVTVEFTRNLQTAAGRMMFAQVVQRNNHSSAHRSSSLRSKVEKTHNPPHSAHRSKPRDAEAALLATIDNQ